MKGTDTPLPPVSSSAIPLRRGQDEGDYNWDQPASTPRALETEEIARVINDYRHAVKNAKRAGFDFIELHAAHGYLVEQFLCDGINQRNDQYGGSIENRCRFLYEVVAALFDEYGAGCVGVRLSPTAVDPVTGRPYQMYFGAISSDAEALYKYAVSGLNEFPLAYLMLTESRVGALSIAPEKGPSTRQPLRNAHFRKLYNGTLIGAGGFTPSSAKDAIGRGIYDIVAFGRWFLSTLDLPERLKTGQAFNRYDRATFYGGGSEGYIDYPDWAHIGDNDYGVYDLIDQSDIGAALTLK